MRKTNIHRLEKDILKKHGKIVGVDEAGRGPLAGPVVAACVVLDKNALKKKMWIEVQDSKVLTDEKRRELVIFIQQNAHDVGIGMASHGEIDRLNILNASLLSMKRAVESLKTGPGHILVDGRFTIPGLKYSQEAIIRGDEQMLSIAAASVVAKVFRDDLMLQYEEKFPEFGFGKHKGYNTEFHRKQLLEHGPCEIHRMSFLPVQEAANKNG